ncbi:hypothetical protein SpCBS45565_g05580 [Spizellomyces sp. 'palustris']|nr:hypothetical protein SpCBS45565_g05580 [Spizellomyces sp. 'palustris']
MGDSAATIAVRPEEEQDEDWEDEVVVSKIRQKDELGLGGMILLTICLTGVQFTWTVELAYGTPYLTSLNLPKALTALVWLAGPLSGLLIQPIVGVYSDKCTLRLGRRRPFMLGGGVLVLMSIGMIAYSREIAHQLLGTSPDKMTSIQAATIIVAVTGFYFLDFSINAVQASCRSLIVDVAPIWQQESANAWGGRMIGVGNVIGYFMGFLDLPKFFPFLGDTQMKVLCWLAGLWFSTSLGLTCWFIKERRYVPDPVQKARAWYRPLFDIFQALRSLPAPLQSICNVQFFAWLGVFPFLFYSTTWVGEKGVKSHIGGFDDDGDMEGTRAGSFAMLLFAIVSLVTGFLLPLITVRGGGDDDTRDEEGGNASRCGTCRNYLLRLLSLPSVWAISIWLFVGLMFSTVFIDTLKPATAIIAAVGISWGTMQWVPFTLLGECINYYAENGDIVTATPNVARESVVRYAGVPEDDEGYGGIPEDDDLARLVRDDATRSQNEGLLPDRNAPSCSSHHLDAGMVLGIHNIYIVLPQFLSTFLCSVVFAIIGYISKQRGGDGRKLGGDIEVDPYDSVGWVLRIGATASIVAGFMALKVRETHGKRSSDVVIGGSEQ